MSPIIGMNILTNVFLEGEELFFDRLITTELFEWSQFKNIL